MYERDALGLSNSFDVLVGKQVHIVVVQYRSLSMKLDDIGGIDDSNEEHIVRDFGGSIKPAFSEHNQI